MDGYFQAVGAIMLCLILNLVLKHHGAEFSTVLTLLVCCVVTVIALYFLQPVLEYIRRIRQLSFINEQIMTIMLKVAGISMTAEIASMVCQDAGNSAMSRTLQFLATAAILYVSLPMFASFLDLIEDILGSL